MTIHMLIQGDAVPIDRDVFSTLLDNSVAGTYVGYEHALESGTIKYAQLVELAKIGDIPLPLFFAPLSLVQAQVETKTRKLLAGVSKDTFAIGSRAKVELRDVELIVKDLIRKQEELRTLDSSLTKNRIVGLLSNPALTSEDAAARLRAAVGLTTAAMQSCRTKEHALELFIQQLEKNQVLVSRSVQHYMPQRLSHVKFSGMTIKDNKVPFIFLAGGDHGDQQEPVGRTIFTLALMTVLIARRVFAPMTWDGGSVDADTQPEFDIAGALLMPADILLSIRPITIDQMKAAADEFKVTPSAVTVRAMQLGIVDVESAGTILAELRSEYDMAPRGGPRNPILPENAVRKYGGRELSRRMLGALDAGRISPGDFCRVVCLNRLDTSQISDLRRVVS